MSNSPESPQPTAQTGKWVPRWRQNPNAVPSVRLYSELQIRERVPGERHSHTFTRALAAEETANKLPISVPAETVEGSSGPASDAPQEPPLAEEFCRVMVHDKAHINPPQELWTRNNIDQLDNNIGKPLPVFMESAAKGRMFEFLGWFRIKAWTRCPGGGKDVLSFVQKRQVSQTARTREYWERALSEDWARVELEKVEDSALRNPMEKAS